MNRNGIPVQDESPTNVEEVLLTLLSKTEILVVDTFEHEFLSSGDQPMLLFTFRLAQILTCGLVLGTNVPMIIFTLNQGSKTFLDWLIIFDCFLCLGNLHVLVILIRLSYDDIGFCVCSCLLDVLLQPLQQTPHPGYCHLQVHSGSWQFPRVYKLSEKSSRDLHSSFHPGHFLSSDWMGHLLQRGLSTFPR